MEINDSVKQMFRAYDIRGIYPEPLSEEFAERLGRAFADFIDKDRAVVSRDARESGESITQAFIRGFTSTGKSIEYTGILPLGIGLFHAWKAGVPFCLVTASHLSREWNGFKFFHGSGVGFMEEELRKVMEVFIQDKAVKAERRGVLSEIDAQDVVREYSSYIYERMKPDRKLRVVVDPGNGAAGVMARSFFSQGFDVDVINEEPDGSFPNRQSNPSSDPLKQLSRAVQDADFGIALDGDGDRLAIMDELGRKLTPEQMTCIILPEILQKEPGPIVANVEVTNVIDRIAEEYKREVFRIRVGHNYLVKSSWDRKASFGLERSGHFTAPWIFPFDDVIAIAYYFGCVLSRAGKPLSRLVDKIPVMPFGQLTFKVEDSQKFRIMEKIKQDLMKKHPNLNTMDGVRIDFETGWALIRPSNTSPLLRLTIEANSKADFEKIKKEYTALLEKYINT